MHSRLLVVLLFLFGLAPARGLAQAAPPVELQPIVTGLSAAGGRTLADLESVRGEAIAGLRGCRALAIRAAVSESRLRVSVNAGGRVISATALVEGSESPDLRRWHRCATRAVSRLRLAAGAAGTLEFSVRWGGDAPRGGVMGALMGEQPGSTMGALARGVGPERPGAGTIGLGSLPPGPRIRLSAPVVTGSMTREVVERIIRRHLNEVRYCYERGLAAAPALEGRLEVSFVIAGTGAVASATIASDTVGSAELGACVVAAVRRWTFPEPAGGGVVVVRYPFDLSPGSAASPGSAPSPESAPSSE